MCAAAVFSFSFNAAADDTVYVRGVEGRLAVYADTNTPRETVAWLQPETVLAAHGELCECEWQAVEPPDSVSLWIYRDLVKDGYVVADKCRVRAGAGLTYRTVTTLNEGQRVEVRGAVGDWLKITPPEGVVFWVLRDQVESLALEPSATGNGMIKGDLTSPDTLDTPTDPAFSSTTSNSAPIQVQPVPIHAVTPSPPPELLGYVLQEGVEQGRKISLSGTLDWGGIGNVRMPFCLVARQPDGDTIPVCHLLAPELTYGPHVGERVSIDGTRWLITGADLPILIPVSIRISGN